MDNLKVKRGIKKTDDWYNIDTTDLKKEVGLRSLLEHYSGSLFKALKVYIKKNQNSALIRL